jgi:hypothetical protein
LSSSDAVVHATTTTPSPARASSDASVTAVGTAQACRPTPVIATSSPNVPVAASQIASTVEVCAAPVVKADW